MTNHEASIGYNRTTGKFTVSFSGSRDSDDTAFTMWKLLDADTVVVDEHNNTMQHQQGMRTIKEFMHNIVRIEENLEPTPRIVSFDEGVITWTATDRAHAYIVERYDTIRSRWTGLATVRDYVTYDIADAQLADGDYTVAVTAVTTPGGNKTERSNSVSFRVALGTVTQLAPEIVSFDENTLVLTWGAVVNAVSYDIMTQDIDTDVWSVLANVNTTTVDLGTLGLADGEHIAAVRAVYTEGTSYRSVPTWFLIGGPPVSEVGYPEIYRVDGTIVRWSTVPEAIGYQVGWQDPQTYEFTILATTAKVNAFDYALAGLTPGFYNAVVRADTGSTFSYWSDFAVVTIEGSVAELSIYIDQNGTLYWNEYPGALSYDVMNHNNGVWEQWANVGGTSVALGDIGFGAGDWEIAMRAVLDVDTYSELSNYVNFSIGEGGGGGGGGNDTPWHQSLTNGIFTWMPVTVPTLTDYTVMWGVSNTGTWNDAATIMPPTSSYDMNELVTLLDLSATSLYINVRANFSDRPSTQSFTGWGFSVDSQGNVT